MGRYRLRLGILRQISTLDSGGNSIAAQPESWQI
jgi:hypothetical protein